MYNRMSPFGEGIPPSPHPSHEDKDSVDLRQLFRTIWRRRKIVLACTFGFAVLAFAIVSQITPTYTSVAKVLLDPRKSQVIGQTEVVSDLTISDQVVVSEQAVLTSNILLAAVIQDIGVERLTSIDPKSADPSLVSQAKGLVKGIAVSVGLASAPKEKTPEQELQNQMERLTFAIRKRIDTHRDEKSFVISVWAATHDAELSMLLAKSVTDQYIELQVQGRRDVAEKATHWIEKRMAVLRQDLLDAEAAATRFRLKSLAENGGSLETASRQLQELSGEMATARAARELAEVHIDQLNGIIERGGIEEAAKLLTSPIMEELNLQRVKLKLEDGVWARDYGLEHPSRKRLAVEIGILDEEIRNEVRKVLIQRRGELEGARSREASIVASLAEMENRVAALSTSALGLAELQRKVNAARSAYEELLMRLNETKSQESLQKADARLIERATVPGGPSAPRPKLIVMLGAMVGMAAGFGLVFFLEMSSTTFRTEEEVEQETKSNVFASLQEGTWEQPIDGYVEMEYEPHGDLAERIRQLRTSLLMRHNSDKGQTVLVTSSVPGEGKTTLSLNLAAMIARSGKSVILVDGDLRCSNLQKTFGWDMEYTLADYLNNECSLADAVHSDPHMPFDVLAPDGADNADVDKLTKDRIRNTLDMLKEAYDVVIIDTPPLLAVSDSLTLAQTVDDILLVIKWNDTTRASVRKSLTLLAEARRKPSGVVLNRVDPQLYKTEFVGEYGYHAETA